MAENKLTFLTEVELPDYCFMSEAVEWIAFGRVPQIQHSEFAQPGEVVDSRFFWAERLDNFEPPYDYPWFDRLEFELLRIPVTEDYFKAAEKCYDEDVHHLPSHIAEYEAKGEIVVEQDQGSKQSRYKEYATKLRQELAELGPLQALVDRVEADFEPHRQIACAKLFQLLAEGLVESQAIDLERWESLSDEGEDEKAIRFDNVPPKAYSLAHKWMENEIVFDEKQHVAFAREDAGYFRSQFHLSSVWQSRFGKSDWGFLCVLKRGPDQSANPARASLRRGLVAVEGSSFGDGPVWQAAR